MTSIRSLLVLAFGVFGATAGCGTSSNLSASDEGALEEREGGTPPSRDGGDGASTSDASDDSITDARDGQRYRTVRFGSRRWLARNLAFETPESYCYDDDPQNCTQYGRLYTFRAAQSACPTNFHLPTDDDWKDLERTLGMSERDIGREGYETVRGSNEGETLKRSGGFAALPAGYRGDGAYDALGDRTYLWTASTRGRDVWRRRIVDAEPTIYRFTNPPGGFAISVRCVSN